VICVSQAQEQADELGHSLKRELAFLFVHGLLHLLGYDHEVSEDEERIMFDLQDQVLVAAAVTR
jgi:rRNA maturation RNase YbeY